MGFRSATLNDKGQLVGGWAKIWKVEDKGNYSVAQVSVSKKKDDGYETEFQNNFVRLVGKAHEIGKNIGQPQGGVNIQILNCDVTNRYDKDKKVEYTNFVIYDFSMDGATAAPKNAAPAKKNADGFMNIPDGVDEELPFN